MQVKSYIEQQLNEHLTPVFLDVQDESHMHNVPDGAQSHFKVTVVSEQFDGSRLIGRHRQVNALLADALEGPVQEWEKRGGSVNASPQCRGGEKSV